LRWCPPPTILQNKNTRAIGKTSNTVKGKVACQSISQKQ
jgi:hypothetical protein